MVHAGEEMGATQLPRSGATLAGRILRVLLPHPIFQAFRTAVISVNRSRPTSTSKITRQSALSRWFRHFVLRKKPRLYHFEIHIADHCNLSCKNCSHFSSISPRHLVPIEQFSADIHAMSDFFPDIHQVYLMGGEPLLHPDIERFVAMARDLLPSSTEISLLTNGILLTKMPDSFWIRLHETDTILYISRYPIDVDMAQIERKAAQFGVRLDPTPLLTQFFVLPLDLSAGQSAYDSFHLCEGYNVCPIIRNGRLYHCGTIAYADCFARYFELMDFAPSTADYFDLAVPKTLANAWRALRFLLTPPQFCAHCDFSRFRFEPWERSKRELAEWL